MVLRGAQACSHHSGTASTKSYDMDAAFMLFKRYESGIHAVRIHPRIRITSHAGTLTTQQYQEPRSGAPLARP
jgi:hypothetical protein